MPAIATPPFSINPIQQVPAPLTVPSYAGVAVPQVSGLHAELVVSSAENVAAMQGRRGFIADPTAHNAPLSHLTAGTVIHPYAHTTQDHTLSMAPGPAHPVNQVSVVVDPRLNPQVSVNGRQRQQQGDHWVRSTNGRMMDTRARHPANNESTSQSGESLFHVMTSNARFSGGRRQDTATMLSSHLSVPGPSGVQHVSGHPAHPPSQSPNSLSPGVSGLSTLETSDDDSDLGSPFHWSLSSSTSPQHIQYIDPPNDYMLSEIESPSTRASSEESSESSPTSQQRAMGSALQTLADAAALLSSSPQSDSNSSEDVHLVANHNHIPNSSNTTGVAPPTTTSTPRSEPPPPQPIATPYSSHPPPIHPSMYRSNHGGVLTMPPQPNVYHPSQLAPAAYHPGPAHLEELPVFVPVIHPSVEHLEPSDSVVPLARGDGTAVLFASHDAGVVMPPQPLPMGDMPPLIRIQGQRTMMPPDQWPAVMEQRTAQQLPPPPPAGFIRPQPMVATAPHAGGFWEEVMVRLMYMYNYCVCIACTVIQCTCTII